MSTTEQALLERLLAGVHEIAAGTRETVRVEPFTAYLDHGRTAKWFSFALPDLPLDEAAAAVAVPKLVAAFTARDRTARVELFDELTPALSGLLEDAGWVLSERIPVMACTPQTLSRPDPPDGVRVLRIRGDEDDGVLRAFKTVQRDAFEDDEPITDEQIAATRERAPHCFDVAAAIGDTLVATAAGMPISHGAVEIGGVATAVAHRGQGIAGTLTAAAAEAAFAAGAEMAWLSAADAAAERIYARAGFAVIGTQSAYDAPAD